MTRAYVRLPDWPARLAEAVERARREPFSWERHNCGLLLADAVLAMTGTDPADALRSEFAAGRRAAWRAVVTRGGVLELMRGLFGGETSVGSARRGDALMFNQGDWPLVGVCLGERAAVTGGGGICFVRSRLAACAWRIG